MKKFWKTVWKMFLSNKARFFSNFAIVFLSISITAGLASMPPSYAKSYSKNYETAPDIILKNKTSSGFSDDQLKEVVNAGGLSARSLFNVDLKDSETGKITRLYIEDLSSDLGKLEVEKGELPTEQYTLSSFKAVCEVGNKNRTEHPIGEDVKLDFSSFGEGLQGVSINVTICGVVNSPLYNSIQLEQAMLDDSKEKEYIDSIVYLDSSLFDDLKKDKVVGQIFESMFINTDIYVRYDEKPEFFTSKYKKEMEGKKDDFLSNYSFKDNVEVLTLEENTSYAIFDTYNTKITQISYIFPLFFVLLCALVNLIIITRLIKDEQPLIATYVSLGVSKRHIVSKYLLFSVISVSLGIIAGLFFGTPVLPKVVLPTYQSIYEMGAISTIWGSFFGYVSAAAVLLLTILVTLRKILSYLNDSPASLMLAKAPKPGKKVFLQKIPFIWNHLSFKFKSSFRNIARQKKNFFLTSFSIIGSTLLVLVGFSLLDVSKSLTSDPIYGDVASSMGSISAVIILFAIAMTVVVIYSLATMNISERARELATLKVLGYHDNECSMYTFREIMIISVVAVIFGLPISALVIAYVLKFLDFGSIWDVKWLSYLYTTLIVLGTTMVVNLLLYPRIKKIDMNDSLKTLD